MATDIDVFAIKEKIVDILDSDSTLFSATGASRKVRKIEAGAPRMRNDLILETTLPHIWVTNDPAIDNLEVYNVSSNAPLLTKHTIGIKIILLAQEKSGYAVEEILDDFVKLINQDITANFDLRTPGGAESTSVTISCKLSKVSELSSTMTGKFRQGRVVTLTLVVVSG